MYMSMDENVSFATFTFTLFFFFCVRCDVWYWNLGAISRLLIWDSKKKQKVSFSLVFSCSFLHVPRTSCRWKEIHQVGGKKSFYPGSRGRYCWAGNGHFVWIISQVHPLFILFLSSLLLLETLLFQRYFVYSCVLSSSNFSFVPCVKVIK